MPPFADMLARLRVAAATGRLPADLGAWAVRELAARADAAERCELRGLRDRLLAEAARALVPDGSTWARACALQAELARVAGAHELIAAALEIDPDPPRSVRQLHTILKSTPLRFQTDQPSRGRR